MAKHGTGARVQTRLYMEGVLVENALVSISANGSIGSPATCQLELVPTNTMRHIMAGTWVHVFVTDPWDVDSSQDLSDFKLFFEGVVISRGFTKMDDGRNFVIQCASPEIYWTNAKQFWLNIGSGNGDIIDQLAVQTSGGYGRFGKVSSTGTFGYMVSKLAFSRKDTEQAEERFIDTLVSVIDDIGNVNPYYTNIRNRMRLTDRIIRAPAGKTEKLFQLALLSDFLEGISGRKSGQTNLIQVINQLLSAILHEWVSILAPPYVKTTIFDRDVFGNIKRRKYTRRHRGPRGRTKVDLYDFKVAQDKVVASTMFKPHVYTIDPPNFNVLFPNMYDQMSYRENFLAETTRLAMKPQLPLVSAGATQGLLLQRPTEVEIFSAIIRDSTRKTNQKRSPDGKYGDSEGQAPTFTDYDWTTNEERIRGIVYNFMNLAPAPSTLTLTDPGKRQPSGTRKGGVPQYLQNVASYEYYKSKFLTRETTVQGPFNMRVVPGFPMVLLDDSESNLNVVCYLDGVQHSIDANGSAMTRYSVKYSRLLDEVDYNRPRFKSGFNANNDLDLSLFRDELGKFHFDTIFDGSNQPPVPEWFDSTYRNTRDLDLQYQEWFGEKAGVIQGVLFRKENNADLGKAVESAADVLEEVDTATLEGLLGAGVTAAGAFINTLKDQKEQFEEILQANENISISDAVTELNRRYRLARGFGKEYEEAARFTARSFTRIDEAFRFVGAAPLELRDRISSDTSAKNRVATFSQNPASDRNVDYKKLRLDKFAGDVSSGSGYSAKGESEAGNNANATEDAANRMSGAFPVFDTVIHTGTQATDENTRQATAKDQSGKSDRARYDGRPLMYDFEFRLWQQSLSNAGLSPTGVEITENSETSDYFVTDAKGNVVRPKTPEEQKDAAKRRVEINADRQQRLESRKRRNRDDPTSQQNMSPASQAPTGDGLEQEEKKALPQPLSEKQVIDLRRSVVEAYVEELKKARGFTG